MQLLSSRTNELDKEFFPSLQSGQKLSRGDLHTSRAKDEPMENGMDCPGQPSGDDPSSSSEGKFLSSPELLQKPLRTSRTSPEQRLFLRILGLTLLLGIVVGIWLLLLAGLYYVSAGFIPNAFYPTSPLIYRLLGPLTQFLSGFMYLLLRSLARLLRHHPDFWIKRSNPLGGLVWPLASLSFGLFFIWMGASQVIFLCFAVDPEVWGTVESVGIEVIGVAFCIETVFYFISCVKKFQGKEEPK
jgi:hypothetical protein